MRRVSVRVCGVCAVCVHMDQAALIENVRVVWRDGCVDGEVCVAEMNPLQIFPYDCTRLLLLFATCFRDVSSSDT